MGLDRKTWGWAVLVSVAQAAKELSVTIYGLRRWIAERRIPVVRLGRRVLIKRADLEQFVEQNRQPAREGGERR